MSDVWAEHEERRLGRCMFDDDGSEDVDARACDHSSGNTHENDDVHCEKKDVDARPREGDTEEGA